MTEDETKEVEGIKDAAVELSNRIVDAVIEVRPPPFIALLGLSLASARAIVSAQTIGGDIDKTKEIFIDMLGASIKDAEESFEHDFPRQTE